MGSIGIICNVILEGRLVDSSIPGKVREALQKTYSEMSDNEIQRILKQGEEALKKLE